MKQATVKNPRESRRMLRAWFRRAEPNRFQHRLHCVLLVSTGKSCTEVASLFGDSARSVQYWVKRFNDEGIEGLYNPTRMEKCLANGAGVVPSSKSGADGIHRQERRS